MSNNIVLLPLCYIQPLLIWPIPCAIPAIHGSISFGATTCLSFVHKPESLSISHPASRQDCLSDSSTALCKASMSLIDGEFSKVLTTSWDATMAVDDLAAIFVVLSAMVFSLAMQSLPLVCALHLTTVIAEGESNASSTSEIIQVRYGSMRCRSSVSLRLSTFHRYSRGLCLAIPPGRCLALPQTDAWPIPNSLS